ncbi:receptor-like serine/threonine-protein kinase SD1-8 [Populus trichocarpa]|uniref:receptor-like serine/threonine-protein kinase SD1-8 n=1 Tax=Populus trichocarpa TaxID=3694 RepID=UPI0022784D32|nr:receptor-like serine/threonine-protein kinase SD1-8 [Populus trichocarpa]
MELPLFSYESVLVATGQFSDKLREGGFGPVYKGNILFQKYPISGWLEFSEAMKLKQTPTGSLEHMAICPLNMLWRVSSQ